MNDLNSLLIEGALTEDAQFSEEAGTAYCAFSIESVHCYRNGTEQGKDVSCFDIETRGKLAETCKKMGKRGRHVRVVGKLKQERWTDADGKPCSKILVYAEHVEFRNPETKNAESKTA